MFTTVSENLSGFIEEHHLEVIFDRGFNAVGLDEEVVPYATRLLDARKKLEGMIGETVKMKNSSGSTIEWTVVKECHQNLCTRE